MISQFYQISILALKLGIHIRLMLAKLAIFGRTGWPSNLYGVSMTASWQQMLGERRIGELDFNSPQIFLFWWILSQYLVPMEFSYMEGGGGAGGLYLIKKNKHPLPPKETKDKKSTRFSDVGITIVWICVIWIHKMAPITYYGPILYFMCHRLYIVGIFILRGHAEFGTKSRHAQCHAVLWM